MTAPARRSARPVHAALIALTALLLTPRASRADGGGAWRDFLPPARASAALAFDPARDRMLMFAGADQVEHADTWSFDGPTNEWTRLDSSGRLPPARSLPAVAFDAGQDRLWMFGGYSGTNALSGLWSLDGSGGGWTQWQPRGILPTARGAGGMVLDPARDRLVLFGGQISPGTGNSGATGDVWTLSPAADTVRWTRLIPSGQAPAARWGAIVVLDAPRDRMIVLGGRDRDSVFTDAWELRFSPSPTWALITPLGLRPPVRDGALGALDEAGGRIVTVGGIDPASGAERTDTWTFHLAGLALWSRLAAGGEVPQDIEHACVAFDPARRRLVLHGGRRPSGLSPGFVSNQTWALDLAGAPAWRRLAPAFETPAPGYGRATAWDPAGSALYVFGGASARAGDLAFSNELWRADLRAPERWSRLVPAGAAPPGRHETVGAYDPRARRVVIFGGWSADSPGGVPRYYDDTWSGTVDSPYVWTRLPGSGEGAAAPAPRCGHAGIYDPLRHSLIVFGGARADSELGDVWELPLAAGGIWRKLEPEGEGPGGRFGASAVYDGAHDRMVIFGGSAGGRSQSDVWALGLGVTPRWRRLDPEGPGPGGRTFGGAAYDGARARMLVLGGYDVEDNVIFSSYGVWALSLDDAPRWQAVAEAGTPPYPATGSSVIYDAARDRMVTFGGRELLDDYLPDFRALEFAPGAPERLAWLLGARLEADGAHLLWQTPPEGSPSTIPIEKRIEVAPEGVPLEESAQAGDWFLEARVAADAQGLLAWTDPGVGAGGAYRYRLGAAGALGGEARIVVPGTPRFAIERVAPQPTTGALSIRFYSSGIGPVGLALYDVRGRRVATRDLGAVPEGRVVVNYEVPPGVRGVCFLRLTQGGRVDTRKVVVAR